jgi:hypothetical protein
MPALGDGDVVDRLSAAQRDVPVAKREVPVERDHDPLVDDQTAVTLNLHVDVGGGKRERPRHGTGCGYQ